MREREIQRGGSGRYREGVGDTEMEREIQRGSERYRDGVGGTEMEREIKRDRGWRKS